MESVSERVLQIGQTVATQGRRHRSGERRILRYGVQQRHGDGRGARVRRRVGHGGGRAPGPVANGRRPVVRGHVGRGVRGAGRRTAVTGKRPRRHGALPANTGLEVRSVLLRTAFRMERFL